MTCAEINPALCLGCFLVLNTNTLCRDLVSVAQEVASLPHRPTGCCSAGEAQPIWIPEPAELLHLQRCFVRYPWSLIYPWWQVWVSPPAVVMGWCPLLSLHTSPWSTLLACRWSGFSSQLAVWGWGFGFTFSLSQKNQRHKYGASLDLENILSWHH